MLEKLNCWKLHHKVQLLKAIERACRYRDGVVVPRYLRERWLAVSELQKRRRNHGGSNSDTTESETVDYLQIKLEEGA